MKILITFYEKGISKMDFLRAGIKSVVGGQEISNEQNGIETVSSVKLISKQA